MDLPTEDVADSRSNVVGRKRALHTSSEQQGREIISIDSSSDESAKQPRKRARQNTEIPSTESFKAEVDLTSSPLQGESKSASTVNSGVNIGQPATWNQGVQSRLRTSLQSKKPSLPQNTSFKLPEQTQNDNGQDSFTAPKVPDDPISTKTYSWASNDKSTLSKKQLNKLSETTQLEVMTAHTKDVAAQIELHGWPIPGGLQQSCMKYIEEGLTFYPTPFKKDQPVGCYSFGGYDVQLREMLDSEGKPIMFEHITYSDVIRALLANNEGLKRALTEKRAKSAFKAFMDYFYRHVPKKDFLNSSLLQNAPLLKNIIKNSGVSSKENVKPKPQESKKLEKSGETSRQKNTPAAPASTPVIDSDLKTASSINFSRSTPPALARAADHYDTNAPSAIVNSGLVEYETSIEQSNAPASDSTTESNGKESTWVAPTLVTNVIDSSRDHRIPTEADTVEMDHRSSDLIIGRGSGTGLPTDGGLVVEVNNDQGFDASLERGSTPELTPEDRAAILKYFPTTDGVVLRICLICGSSGHGRALCPNNSCSSCGSKGNHLTAACPRTIVCDCMLPRKISDVLNANRQAIMRVNAIPFGEVSFHDPMRSKRFRICRYIATFVVDRVISVPQCGLYRGKPASGGITWSNNNMEKYVDFATSYDAMSLGGNDYSIPSRAKKGFSIKGKANDPIDLDDSDDDDAFLHPKVNTAPRTRGQIQFSQAGAMQSFNQAPPFQFQGNAGGNPSNRGSFGNRGGRGGRGGGGGSSGSSGEKKKSKHKSGNSPTRGGRGKAYRGRGGGGGGPARGAPRGRH